MALLQRPQAFPVEAFHQHLSDYFPRLFSVAGTTIADYQTKAPNSRQAIGC